MTDRRGSAIITLTVGLAMIVGCTGDNESSAPTTPSVTTPAPTATAPSTDSDEEAPDPSPDLTEIQSERNVAIPDSIPFSVDCDDDTLGADDEYAFPTAYFVVDGTLGELCRGESDARLVDAWDTLATIAPAHQLTDLGVFSAFEVAEDESEITLAFVRPLDVDGTQFQMAIGLES